MTILGLLDGARSRDVLVGGILLALLLAGTSDANEGCGNTPDDSQMMSVLKQAADMFMPCIEGLYHTPIHGSILEEAVQGICRNFDKCSELGESWGACFVETTAEFLATVKDFPYEPNTMAQKSVVSVEIFTLCNALGSKATCA
ncbi:uncharacterized protein LOC119434670 [Dermacentor silvarum]|uniref:uncharacterized protein LOC119434670 n=1 Tax=Dermacentor silvarum TaxID=543639 RepID=UPI00189A1916|nr:uncharacterized protein LOC119434670 [Dermacentor silvarum]